MAVGVTISSLPGGCHNDVKGHALEYYVYVKYNPISIFTLHTLRFHDLFKLGKLKVVFEFEDFVNILALI